MFLTRIIAGFRCAERFLDDNSSICFHFNHFIRNVEDSPQKSIYVHMGNRGVLEDVGKCLFPQAYWTTILGGNL